MNIFKKKAYTKDEVKSIIEQWYEVNDKAYAQLPDKFKEWEPMLRTILDGQHKALLSLFNLKEPNE